MRYGRKNMKSIRTGFAILLALCLAPADALGTWKKITPKDYTFNGSGEEFSVGYGGHLYLTGRYTFSYRRSDDGGASWKAFTPVFTAVSGMRVGPIVPLPTGELFQYIMYETDEGAHRNTGLFRSLDQGLTWNALIDSIPGNYGEPILTAGYGGDDLYLVSAMGDDTADTRRRSLWVSTDKGLHWTRAADFDEIIRMAASPEDDIYVTGTRSGKYAALYASRNAGVTWDSVYSRGGTGLPRSLAANRKSSALLGMSDNGFAMALPGGGVISRMFSNGEFGGITACAITADYRAVIACDRQGVYFTDTAFNDFTAVNAGMGADSGSVKLLQYDAEGNLYAHAGADLYVLPAAHVGLAGKARPGLKPAAKAGWDRDLQGRKIRASRPALIWSRRLP
jgi:hypothetical protein